MTFAEYDINNIPNNDYIDSNAIPKNVSNNWITSFLIGNPTRNLDYVTKLVKFKMQEKEYHQITVTLKNGLRKKMLFWRGDCVAEEYLNPKGGAREGSGRKTKDESGRAVTVSFSCSPEQKELLQKDAAESGMKQSEYILSKLF